MTFTRVSPASMDQPISSVGSGRPSSPMAASSWRRSAPASACGWGPTSVICASRPTRRGTHFEPTLTPADSLAPGRWTGSVLQKPVSHRPAGDALCRRQDRVDVEAVVAVELGQRSGLAEMLHTQRAHAVAADAANPGQRLGIGVRHGDDGGIARQLREQALDVCTPLALALLARTLGRVPAR